MNTITNEKTKITRIESVRVIYGATDLSCDHRDAVILQTGPALCNSRSQISGYW